MANTLNDVMTKNLVTLNEKTNAREAAKKMREMHVGNVLVTRDEALCGIVTDRDLVVRCMAEGKDADKTHLADLCSEELVTLSPDSPVGEAIKLMTDKAIRRLPVTEGEKPVGIVSLGDLALMRDRDSALGEISAANPNR
jgi:CBS domain-containing protein